MYTHSRVLPVRKHTVWEAVPNSHRPTASLHSLNTEIFNPTGTASALLPVSSMWSYPAISVLPGWYQRAPSAMLSSTTVCYISDLNKVESTCLEYMWDIGKKPACPLNPQPSSCPQTAFFSEKECCHLNVPSRKSSPPTITHYNQVTSTKLYSCP